MMYTAVNIPIHERVRYSGIVTCFMFGWFKSITLPYIKAKLLLQWQHLETQLLHEIVL